MFSVHNLTEWVFHLKWFCGQCSIHVESKFLPMPPLDITLGIWFIWMTRVCFFFECTYTHANFIIKRHTKPFSSNFILFLGELKLVLNEIKPTKKPERLNDKATRVKEWKRKLKNEIHRKSKLRSKMFRWLTTISEFQFDGKCRVTTNEDNALECMSRKRIHIAPRRLLYYYFIINPLINQHFGGIFFLDHHKSIFFPFVCNDHIAIDQPK